MKKLNLFYLSFLAIAIVLFYIFVDNQFYKSILIYVMINAINASMLNILFGYTGVISLGQAAFYGIGAYTTGILTVHFGYNPLLTILIGIVIASFVAFVVGYPTLKLHGHYLAMATLGFGMIMYILFNEFSDYTGGPSGLVGIPKLSLFGFSLDNEDKFYVFISIFFFIFSILLELFDKSYMSYKLKFIKESEFASKSFGVNVSRVKLIVFVVVAAITSLTGSVFALYSGFISPISFNLKYSIDIFIMATVGGLGSIVGGTLGATMLTAFPELITNFEDYEMIVYGILLLIIIMFFPQGIAGIFKKFWGRYVKS
ncbi:branched-chain amino acid ABC transporter permease [Calditerrivibrio nitroreducens]|uniref:Amino acid/amide ABC transporter membrane protein 2, HAAT family n=1 Tax=Calditerrivibrio nitroreducens (strain DSM 19672 / NBRC 101217 / Yu37-1) TaxID=768670 RepID=E4THB1_CALNY|nr:branched-chain amino acid ABC transporter permease [Calditerrivibrio nitroreducens]ADR18805.1 amino acid/amide ABC transporter membrane protein 2, HAAT family [Calditerrivibrio nitroreducens DSM 19672]